jgi:hypothetical protein
MTEIHDYYQSKLLSDLTLQELAYAHLDSVPGTFRLNNGTLSSCLNDLIEAGSASFNNFRTKQYVPLLAYFSILDQIGGIYERTNMTCSYKNGIKRALSQYSSFTIASDLEMLVTLRHGIFHDGSLVYKNTTTGTNVVFRMTVNSQKLLTYGKNIWDGIYHDDMTDFVTKIDLKKLQEVTNEVVKNCKESLLNGSTVCKTASTREFFYKYLFIV